MRAPFTEASADRTSSSGSSHSDRPTRAIVDLDALGRNFDQVLRRAGDRIVLAVVKARAYGHGAVPASLRLLRAGARILGVALVEEGRELRSAGITAPVLVMGALFPEQADAVVDLGLIPVVYSMDVARALSAAAVRRGRHLPVHVKIDTGMGRIGISPAEGVPFVSELKRLEAIEVQGLMTHFADADLADKAFCAEQLDRFEGLVRDLHVRGIDIPLRHAANSAAVIDYPRALFTMVRPGLMLYGYNPLAAGLPDADLQPVLSLVTRIASLKRVPAGMPISYGRTFTTRRESLIATIPVGYADGFCRSLSNRGEALVRGARVPVAGRVCMDMCMLDVTDVPGVSEQDEVVLIGAQGGERISAEDIARTAGTIPYEVLCGLSQRVPREYRQAAPGHGAA